MSALWLSLPGAVPISFHISHLVSRGERNSHPAMAKLISSQLPIGGYKIVFPSLASLCPCHPLSCPFLLGIHLLFLTLLLKDKNLKMFSGLWVTGNQDIFAIYSKYPYHIVENVLPAVTQTHS